MGYSWWLIEWYQTDYQEKPRCCQLSSTQVEHTQIILDPTGDAFVPHGYKVIRSEIEFLRHALDKAQLFIQGKAVCRWADAFYRGRNIAFIEAASPRKALRDAVPLLTEEQIAALLAEIRERFVTLCQPVKAIDLLELLYPDGPWHPVPSLHHAAQWLLWLSDQHVADFVVPVLTAQLSLWMVNCAEDDAVLYAPQSSAEAQHVMKQWLGIVDRTYSHNFKPFPLPISSKWQQVARQEWTNQIVQLESKLFYEVHALPLPSNLHVIAAEVTFDFYKANPGKLTRKMVNSISGYLTSDAALTLQRLCPQPDPGDLPSTPEAIFKWFTDCYMPYRQWQVSINDDAARIRVSQLAADFAKWCLGYYPNALSNAKSTLAISRAALLHSTREDCVTLWPILDGLHFADAQTLSQLIGNETRLTLISSDVALAPLPTITRFCKKAVLYGKPPSMVEDLSLEPNFPGAISLPENKTPDAKLREAKPGDVFVWRLEEPDKTYHKPFDRKTLLAQVSAKLQYLAERITLAALAIPNHLAVRVVIATDHGRLLSTGNRSHTIPPGMETHGRSAYGPSGKDFSADGYLVQEHENVAYLHASRFRLPTDCAVVLDSDSFVTNDGKSGKEEFSHGGLFPEEVLVPWIEFVRDWTEPLIRCNASGQSVAGRSGVLRLDFQHPGKILVRATTLTLNLDSPNSINLALDLAIPPLTSTTAEVTLERWPTETQCQRANGAATISMPNGKTFQVPVEFNWSSNEMYKSELDADDLLQLGE
jgi:hypothetical protein